MNHDVADRGSAPGTGVVSQDLVGRRATVFFPGVHQPVATGFALSAAAGAELHWGLFVVTLLGVLCFHTAANLLNDCYDWRRGLDTEGDAMSGGILQGLLDDRQSLRGAVVFLAAGTACGLFLVWVAGWVVLLLGLIGAAIALAYTGPRFCLKYAGLGDAAIFVAFGPLPMFGTWWVQTQTFSWAPLLWAMPAACYTVAILHSNNWRDIENDAGSGCRTFAGMLGRARSRRYYRFLMLGPFAMIAAFLVMSRTLGWPWPAPWSALLAFGALPLAWRRAFVDGTTTREDFLSLLARTAQLDLLFAVLLSVGFFLALFL